MDRRSFFGSVAAAIGGLSLGVIPGKPTPVPKFCFGMVDITGKIIGHVPIVSLDKITNGWVFKAREFLPTETTVVRGITIFDKKGRAVKSMNFFADVPVTKGDTLKTHYTLSAGKNGMNPEQLLEQLRLREQENDPVSRKNPYSRSNHTTRGQNQVRQLQSHQAGKGSGSSQPSPLSPLQH